MTTFVDELRKLQELESEIVNVKEFKITVPYEVDGTLFYTFIKRLWYEKFDTYAGYTFPLGNYIEADNEFKMFPMKPWGIVGVHKIKESYIQSKGVKDI